MALEYRLTLAGGATVEQVAARAIPDPPERPSGAPPVLSADLFDKYGFQLTVHGGDNGYVDALGDDGPWEWEPAKFVAVGFRLDKFADAERVVTNMATVVRRLLASGPEDASFVFNGDALLLTRFDGALTKQSTPTWWSYHPAANQLIAG